MCRGYACAGIDKFLLIMNETEKNDMIKDYYNQLNNAGCLRPTLMYCILVILLLICSCCPCRKIATDNNSNHEVKDSVRTEIRYEKVTKYIHDTTYVTIPAQESINHTLADSSHLENQYCSSDAKINPDGSLYHDLKTKPQNIPVPFEKPVTTITESEHHEHTTTDVTDNHQTVTEYIERDYTWWDKTRFYASYVLFAWLLINYRKFFKNILSSIIKRIFS